MSGSGTEDNSYQITNLEQLRAVKEDLSAHYELANDIDASNSKQEEFKPIGDFRNGFTGTFDGNNYVIKNLCIIRPEESYVGMFSHISETGQLKNLGLTNATIEGKTSVGGVVGLNEGKVESSYSKGVDVSGDLYVGGVVGSNSTGGTVESFYVRGESVSGHMDVGGHIGFNTGRVESSYTLKSNVSGNKKVGGLVGSNYGTVNLSYTAVDISGDEYVGGLIGKNNRQGVVNSSFVFSNLDGYDNWENCDLLVLTDHDKMSYVVKTRMLYLVVGGDKYSRSDVSPLEAHELAQSLGEEIVEMSEHFRSSVVAI